MPSFPPCAGCGWDHDAVGLDAVNPRVAASVLQIQDLLASGDAWLAVRPDPERWSALEYAAHVRDVLLSLRDRIIAGVVADEPTGSPIYRDERASAGFYALDTAPALISHLETASQLLRHAVSALTATTAERTILYSPVTPIAVTVRQVAVQAAHELEHHLSDIRHNQQFLKETP